MKKECYLGLDLSTQSLTAVLIEPGSRAVRQHSIDFDDRYPSYGTEGGVILGADPREVHADPRMWLEALDDMFAWLKKHRLTTRIRGIGVSAQQHGSVYLKKGAFAALAAADPARPLAEQLGGIFSRSTSPIWMDSSTRLECEEITASLGGDEKVAALTGSVATERFAAPQIRKFWKINRADYEKTDHIALISSFITSVLLGGPAPVDGGDGFGTNLADIRAGSWSKAAVEAAAPALQDKLPELKPGNPVVGRVSPYLAGRYGFDRGSQVVIGSGDNPCSLVGLGLLGKPDIHAISLGTSDTYFGYQPVLAERPHTVGHVFGTADGRTMFLVCFKNGSLARERIKDRFGLSWQEFSDILLHTPPGNRGRILLPYFLPEITPPIPEPGIRRFGGLQENDIAGNVRAVAEAQVISMYLHSGWTGRRPESIVVTAGGSENLGLLQVIAQVFGTQVRSYEVKDSAALGAALKAAHGCLQSRGGAMSWQPLAEPYLNDATADVIEPAPHVAPVYQAPNGLIDLYAACESHVRGLGPDPSQKISNFSQKQQDLP